MPVTLELKFQDVFKYKLIGAIQVYSSLTKSVKSRNLLEDLNKVSHYVALIQRYNGYFVKCDGLKESVKAEKVKPNYKFIPEILIYFMLNE